MRAKYAALIYSAAFLVPEVRAQTVNDFESATAGTEYGFRFPTFSGTTTSNLLTSPNETVVLQGWDTNPTKLARFDFEFVDSSTFRWVRMTTFNANGVPNPAVRTDHIIHFEIYSENDIRVAIGIREDSDVAGPVGADGGTTGLLEWAGAERATQSAGTPPGGLLVSGGSWQSVEIDLTTAPIHAFTGDGSLDGRWGTLENLAITSTGQAAQTVYVDNFRVTNVPEPRSALMVWIALLLGISRRPRFRSEPGAMIPA